MNENSSNSQTCVVYTRLNPQLYGASWEAEKSQREKACRAYVQSRQLKLLGAYHDSTDAEPSTPRPQLQKVLGLAAQGAFNQLVVYNPFCLSSKGYTMQSIRRFLDLCHVRLVCLYLPSQTEIESQ